MQSTPSTYVPPDVSVHTPSLVMDRVSKKMTQQALMSAEVYTSRMHPQTQTSVAPTIHPIHFDQIGSREGKNLPSSPSFVERVKQSASPTTPTKRTRSKSPLAETTLQYEFTQGSDVIQSLPVTYQPLSYTLHSIKPIYGFVPVSLFSKEWHEIMDRNEEQTHSLQMSSRELFKKEETGLAQGMHIGNWQDEVQTIVRRFRQHQSIAPSISPTHVTEKENLQELLFLIIYNGPKKIFGSHNEDLTIDEEEKVARLTTLLNECFQGDVVKITSFLAMLGKEKAPSDVQWRVRSICDNYISHLKSLHFSFVTEIPQEENWVLAHIQRRLQQTRLEPLPKPGELQEAPHANGIKQEAEPPTLIQPTQSEEFMTKTLKDWYIAMHNEESMEVRPLPITTIEYTPGADQPTENIELFSPRYFEIEHDPQFQPMLRKIMRAIFSLKTEVIQQQTLVDQLKRRLHHFAELEEKKGEAWSEEKTKIEKYFLFLLTYRPDQQNTISEDEQCRIIASLLQSSVPSPSFLLNMLCTIGTTQAVPEEIERRVYKICDHLIESLHQANIEILGSIEKEHNWVLSYVQEQLTKTQTQETSESLAPTIPLPVPTLRATPLQKYTAIVKDKGMSINEIPLPTTPLSGQSQEAIRKTAHDIFSPSANWQQAVKEQGEAVAQVCLQRKEYLPNIFQELSFLLLQEQERTARSITEAEKCTRLSQLVLTSAPFPIYLSMLFTLGNNQTLDQKSKERILGIVDQMIPQLVDEQVQLLRPISEKENWIFSYIQSRMP